MGIHNKWKGTQNDLVFFEQKEPTAKSFAETVEKFNPYHDAKGRFATADTATLFTIRTKDSSKQGLANAGIDREKERTADQSGDKRKQTIRAVEDKIRNRDYETAACIDKNGEVLFYKDGGRDYVKFSKWQEEMFPGNTLTHNHPDGTHFSDADVNCFVSGNMAELRATNSTGKTYVLRRPEGYDFDADTELENPLSSGRKFVSEFREQVHFAETIAQYNLDNQRYFEKIQNGEITKKQADDEFNRQIDNLIHGWLRDNAKNFNVEYAVEE